MPLDGIIFDCDGVILESVAAKTAAMARLAAPFGPDAVAALIAYHEAHGGVSRFEKFKWFFREQLGREILSKELKDWGSRFSLYTAEEINVCAFVPGIVTVLKAWRGRVPLYVASGTPQEELECVLDRRHLGRYFNGIFGSPPDKTALLTRILQLTGLLAQNVVMVGDSQTDLDAANAVQMRFYGRGKYFENTGFPWHTDLTRLNAWLEKI